MVGIPRSGRIRLVKSRGYVGTLIAIPYSMNSTQTKGNEMKTIDIQILDGNLTNDDIPGDDLVDDYVDMLRAAVAAEYPGAEINIDLQRPTSGASRPTSVIDYDDEDDPGTDNSDAEYMVSELEGNIWVEWCEKHDLA